MDSDEPKISDIEPIFEANSPILNRKSETLSIPLIWARLCISCVQFSLAEISLTIRRPNG